MKKRKLPLGIQHFAPLREDGFVYVDKTQHIYELVTNAAGPMFLARPRRFGKSLLCSTLAALFEGKRELFKGLAIDNSDWEWTEYPVVRIDLNPASYGIDGVHALETVLNSNLKRCAEQYNIQLENQIPGDSFAWLIIRLHQKYNKRVAVIIDEYDKPMLDTIDTPEEHKKIREILRGFYGVLKSAEYTKFVFLTGITKFSQVSVFSQLNNLQDITLNPDYAALCGLTQEELEENFAPEIERCAAANDCDTKTYLERARQFYNGYRFTRNPIKVYNPFGIINHFVSNGEFEAHWFATGTPSFLIKLIDANKIDIAELENEAVTAGSFQNFNIDNLDAVTLLYQAGYLTIKNYEGGMYYLDYPNDEVRFAFARSLLEYYLQKTEGGVKPNMSSIAAAMIQGDVEKAMKSLESFFEGIPYTIQLDHEKYYQTVIHLVFRMLGLNCHSEIATANGRIDTLVETGKYMYFFEFKLNGTAEDALAQINEKNYLLPWRETEKKLFKIGVEFYKDKEKRNIGKYLVECGDV